MKKNIFLLLILLIIFLMGGLIINNKDNNTIYTVQKEEILYEIHNKNILINLNEEINLLDNISYENCTVNIDGSYNLSQEGIYNLNYLISNEDKEIKEPFTLIVASNISKTSKDFDIYTINNVTFVDKILVVNKSYGLGKDYIPVNTNQKEICKECLDSKVMEEYFKMQADAFTNNLNLYISSGYRSFIKQQELYTAYVTEDGKDIADKYSARAGYSEHQTGLAFDLNSVDSSFLDTPEGKWVNENCYKYGFIIRYPKDKENITGYKYEPWHLRYVGQDLATKLYNNGDWLTIEEYYGIKSEYKD